MMKALYKVTFRYKTEPQDVSDTFRIVYPASLAGLKAVCAWAEIQSESYEYPAEIEQIERETR